MSTHDRVEAAFISLIHDYLIRLFVNADKMLLSAGIKKGDNVLEVGCGPGFFTLPAAEIVGEDGYVYANDINPIFIKKVEKKLRKSSTTNAQVMLEDVTKTSLENDSIDVAFFFGVFHNLTSILDEVFTEMHRILKPDGLIAIQKSGKPIEKYLPQITKDGKFEFLEQKERVILFKKK